MSNQQLCLIAIDMQLAAAVEVAFTVSEQQQPGGRSLVYISELPQQGS